MIYLELLSPCKPRQHIGRAALVCAELEPPCLSHTHACDFGHVVLVGQDEQLMYQVRSHLDFLVVHPGVDDSSSCLPGSTAPSDLQHIEGVQMGSLSC